MSKKIFPKEIIEETTQHHFWKHTIRSQVLYSSVLLSVAACLAVLPILYVDVSVKSSGIIRPESEIKVLVSPVSGRILRFEMAENKTIPKGKLLVKVDTPILQERLNYIRNRRNEIEDYIRDLSLLVRLDTSGVLTSRPGLATSLYNNSFLSFRQQLVSATIKLQNSNRLYSRKKYLFEKDAISFAELEESKYAFNTAQSSYRLLFNQQLAEWQTDLAQYQQELDELSTEEKQLMEELRQYEINMPVTGTVQNLAGISEGSYLQLNQRLADISPDTGLVAECYLSPNDIGLIKKGMEARFQIGAFDYNHWGSVSGKVIDISSDAVMKNDRPFFLVQASLDRTNLELPNGYKGYLKKGMTLQARFKVTERSLYQLLYDNVDDWLNPSENTERQLVQHKQIPGKQVR